MPKITVIGAGLAGSEAALQIANRGLKVHLFEMRPQQPTEAHITSGCAELVCSNSFGSETPNSASRILKDELQELGCTLLSLGKKHRVPAGGSLAIDREKFSQEVTSLIENHPNITFCRQPVEEIPQEGIVIVATGPLTSASLSASLQKLLGSSSLFFYDAISPIVSADSLNLEKMFWASRWDKGEADFLNIPLTKEQYETFVQDILAADVVLPHDFEEGKYFESCLPIEVIASRGKETLAFGPMKPVGLRDLKTGKRAHAVVQLRAENAYKTAFNLVGFQTKMKYKEQERIFRKLPGLENAEFLRLGSLHRNTFVDSPKCLKPTLQLRQHPQIFLAGQITGTEGYLESIACGFLAGFNACRLAIGAAPLELPEEMILGALLKNISDENKTHFQPTNVNLGLFPPLSQKYRDKAIRNLEFSKRSNERLSVVGVAFRDLGTSAIQ